MNDKQKIVTFILALTCNFTFLLTAQTSQLRPEALKLPECIQLHGKDSLETRRNMAVFQENFNNKDFAFAYKCWTYVFVNAPCLYKSIYQRGPQLLAPLIDNPAYAARKQKLIDTLMMVFPARIMYFGEDALVKGSWGFNMSKYKPEKISDILNLYKFYVDSTEISKLNSQYLRDYLRNAANAVGKALYTKEQLFNLYDRLSNISFENKTKLGATDTNEYKDWHNTGLLLDKTMKPFFKCADIDLIYQPKLKADPDNKELVNKAIKMYKADPLCKDNPHFIELIEKSFTLEPNAVAAEELGHYFKKKKNNTKAIQYLEKAADMTTDIKKKEDLFLELANMNLATNISIARSYANKVQALNPNNGEALIIEGMALYRAKCGGKFEQSMAACAAVELFNRAKNLDPKCADKANKQIAATKPHFPTKAEAFFLGLKDGDSYTIPCSGITATVKTR